ncbi:MAG: hypothetical protein DWQ34_18130 [Planctomycetota bacterium]|nr:MAG: hypothetical protein DWQ29_23055 [Planctomycetota bacterium]REJ90104.1 MAG: hypothetical protein DWQ34_18130 [Planctomycetota bacterium]REK21054.1 MAG: hypothetical protein DWQ41_22930 [Planctomycetota bacterium]REK38871.1 MAG: hypothetical protein DWQ45_03225 [Planctomycetota bacterium]
MICDGRTTSAGREFPANSRYDPGVLETQTLAMLMSPGKLPVVCTFAVAAACMSSAARGDATLTCRVLDADTGRPLECRVSIESTDGEFHFVESAEPDGSAVRYDVSRSPQSVERHTTVSPHPFTVELPAGEYTLRVERGKEYHPATLNFEIGETPVERTVQLRRWINLAERGWYSGDTHVHRTIEELPNVMLAEDLNVALPLSYWVRTAYTPPAQGDETTAVSGALIQIDDTHVIWPMNTEYEIFTVNGKPHTLGAVFVLNHQQPLKPAAPPVGPIAAVAREQGAILDLDKHSWPWSMMLVPVMDVDLFELSNNHVWQTEFFFKQWTIEQLPPQWRIQTDEDGFTEWGWIDFGFKTYYALLNCGFRMRPTAGTASGVHPVPLGFGRVYVQLPDGFSYDAWMDGLDAGRSFVTTGPMLFAEFGGEPPGAAIEAQPGDEVRVAGTVESAQPLSRIEIVRNGQVVEILHPALVPGEDGRHVSRFDRQIPVARSSWIAVRAFAGEPGRERIRFAHSAPVFVEVADKPLRPKQHEVQFLVNRMERELERNQGVLSEDELAEYEQALRIYREIAEQAE